jgi:hypothetical protein
MASLVGPRQKIIGIFVFLKYAPRLLSRRLHCKEDPIYVFPVSFLGIFFSYFWYSIFAVCAGSNFTSRKGRGNNGPRKKGH